MGKSWSKLAKQFSIVYVGLVGAYFYFSWIYPTDNKTLQKYDLSFLQGQLISLSIAIPLALIWIVAIIGYLSLRSYTRFIRDQADGQPMNFITIGCLLLALQLPIRGLLRNGFNYFTQNNPDLLPTSVITINYVNLAFSLLAFLFISRGAHGLANLVQLRPSLRTYYILFLSFTTIGVIYCLSVFQPSSLDSLSSVLGSNTYFLPMWLLISTIMIPYLYIWSIGLFAAYEIFSYQREVRGLLYRQSLRYLSIGVATMIFSSIFLQYVISAAGRFNKMTLSLLLVGTYLLLLCLAAGFVFVALGAKKLQKLEEI